ncbi:hypothetical protein ACTPEF_24210, partial [Clostridioides difficile]
FKDDVKEVNSGYECGMSFVNYNDIKEGDIVEAYITKEVERKLPPQVRHRFDYLKAFADEVSVPCALIQAQAYSPLGGPKLLKQV